MGQGDGFPGRTAQGRADFGVNAGHGMPYNAGIRSAAILRMNPGTFVGLSARMENRPRRHLAPPAAGGRRRRNRRDSST